MAIMLRCAPLQHVHGNVHKICPSSKWNAGLLGLEITGESLNGLRYLTKTIYCWLESIAKDCKILVTSHEIDAVLLNRRTSIFDVTRKTRLNV